MLLDYANRYIEENDGIKYLVFASTDENKEVLKKYTKLWEETKRPIEVINDGERIKYKKDFMKIKFESEGDFPLGKTFIMSDMITVAASALDKNGKNYPQWMGV